jgi:MSHA biogenesis protein MshM
MAFRRLPTVWKRHWRLSGDPFLGPGAPFVGSSGHDEALARLVDSIETGQRLALLRGGEGLGKSTLLARAMSETRRTDRRFARVDAPLDGAGMFATLASGLGTTVLAGAGRGAAWKALADAVRLCRWQKIHAVLVIDDCQELTDPSDRRDLERLAHLDPNPSTRLTVVQSFRDPHGESASAWQLSIRLSPLTRSESTRYLAEKLAAAGRLEPLFTPRASNLLHDLSGGIPRALDRLGSLALMAGALRGLEMVTPEVIDGAARECTV